ncbi:YciI family protein [Sphaerisporangium corydalis]|uniref:YciI family protein n=1 Tax=Sphaerisporangium corydalis TaxID=1441875 RepID=A0ABV9E9B4_9ACTN|nr:YciI family protein [Sphaerisporangium corydalis]
MTRYLLSIYQPDGPPPGPEIMDQVDRDLRELNGQMKAAGAWVFTGPLHPADSATVVQRRGGEVVMTDGPYLEGKEHVGGFWIIDAVDLDEALEWGTKANRAIGLPIEVRPFAGPPTS